MPRVPTRDAPIVRTEPLRQPLQGPMTVDTRGLAQGLMTASQAIEESNLQVEQIELQEADAALETQWNAQLYTNDDAYFKRKGKTAFESEAEVADQLQKTAADITANLPSGSAKRIFETSYRDRLARHRISVGRHSYDERQVWDINSAKAGTTAWLETVSLDTSRIPEGEQRVTELTQVIQEKEYGAPVGSDQSETAVFDAKSGLYLHAILGRVITPDGLAEAERIFAKYGESMNLQDRMTSTGQISALKNQKKSQDKALLLEAKDQVAALNTSINKYGIMPQDTSSIGGVVSAIGDDVLTDMYQDAIQFAPHTLPFAKLSPNGQAEELRRLETNVVGGGGSAMDAKLLDTLKGLNDEHTRQIKKDSFLYYTTHQRGGRVPSLALPGPMSGFDDKALSQRKAIADEATQFLFEGTEQKVLPFSETEFPQIAAMYNEGGSAMKTSLVNTIAQTQGDLADPVFKHLNKKGAHMMGSMAAMTLEGQYQVSQWIAIGQEIRKNEPELAPTEMFTAHMNHYLGNAYERGTPMRKTAEQSIMAIYAALASRPGSGVQDGVIDDNLFETAVNQFTGGLVQFRGETMPAPARGAGNVELHNWVNSLSTAPFQNVRGFTPEAALDVLKGEKNNARLITRGQGEYAVGWYGPSNELEVGLFNKDGSELLLRYEPVEFTAPPIADIKLTR